MSEPKLNIGAMRHRICLWQRIEQRDASGGIDYAYQVYADRVPAAIEPARVIAAFAGDQLQKNFDVLIRVRWMSGLRTNMLITWDAAEDGSPTAEKCYEITGVRVRNEVRHEVFLQCIERQSDGWRRI